jgi:hypothetical protein
MSEINIIQSRKIIVINKKALTFNLSTSSKFKNQKSECTINIKNSTYNYVVLRIRTNNKQEYSVVPSSCIIKPDESIDVQFVLILKSNQLNPHATRFKFEAITINNCDKDKEPSFLFEYFRTSNRPVEGNIIKLGVEFITMSTKNGILPGQDEIDNEEEENEDDDNFKSRTPKVSKNRKMHFDNKNRILSSRAGNSASKHKPKFLLKSILETSNDEPFSTQIDDTIHNSNVLTEPNLTSSIFSTATTNTEPNVRKEEKLVDDCINTSDKIEKENKLKDINDGVNKNSIIDNIKGKLYRTAIYIFIISSFLAYF